MPKKPIGRSSTMNSKKNVTAHDQALRFKETFSRRDVFIHFVGVWYVPLDIERFLSQATLSIGTLYRQSELFGGKACPERIPRTMFATSDMLSPWTNAASNSFLNMPLEALGLCRCKRSLPPAPKTPVLNVRIYQRHCHARLPKSRWQKTAVRVRTSKKSGSRGHTLICKTSVHITHTS